MPWPFAATPQPKHAHSLLAGASARKSLARASAKKLGLCGGTVFISKHPSGMQPEQPAEPYPPAVNWGAAGVEGGPQAVSPGEGGKVPHCRAQRLSSGGTGRVRRWKRKLLWGWVGGGERAGRRALRSGQRARALAGTPLAYLPQDPALRPPRPLARCRAQDAVLFRPYQPGGFGRHQLLFSE